MHVIPRVFAAFLVATLAGATVARAQEQPPIKIGVIYSYTGASPAAGQALDASMNAWLAMHNNVVGGRKVQIIRRDDTGPAPDVARRMAQELVVQDKVDFLLGSIYTPNAIAIKAVSTASKVPFFIVNAATAGIINDAPYAVRLSAIIASNTIPLAKYAAQHKMKTAYSLVSDYAPGIESAEVFTKAFEGTGGKMLGDTRSPVTANDFTAYVQRIKDAKPQANFTFVVAGTPAVAFFKAAKTAELAKSGVSIIVNGATVDELDLDAIGDTAIGVISACQYSWVHPSKLNDQYIAAYRKVAPAGAPVPDYMAEAGYDILSAIDKAVAAQKGALDPEKSMAVLKGLKLDSPRGPIEIDARTREVIQNIYIRRGEKRGNMVVNAEIETFPHVTADATF